MLDNIAKGWKSQQKYLCLAGIISTPWSDPFVGKDIHS